mmetsp:Transcript_22770/g.40362  ORF Transcript_22770/g.40362 Transcript_22770/m.40362 type:complete len:132 (+) Transcript_22770:99-494(+)
MSLEVLDDSMFEQKLGQVRRQPSEKDRFRLIKNLCNNFVVSAPQALGFVHECHTSSSKIDAAAVLYSVLSEEEKPIFVEEANTSVFQFADERETLCERLGIDVVEPRAPEPSAPGVQISRFDQQETPGYST